MSLQTQKFNFTIRKNTNLTFTFDYVDSDGVPIDMTLYDLKLQVRENAEDADPALITLTLGSGLSVLLNVGTVMFAPADTENLEPKNYVYNLFALLPDTTIESLFNGVVTIEATTVRPMP